MIVLICILIVLTLLEWQSCPKQHRFAMPKTYRANLGLKTIRKEWHLFQESSEFSQGIKTHSHPTALPTELFISVTPVQSVQGNYHQPFSSYKQPLHKEELYGKRGKENLQQCIDQIKK